MNTFEARSYMRDKGQEALLAVVRHIEGQGSSAEERTALRRLAAEARELLVDAGYPGEAVWRGIQRASIGVETMAGEPDRYFWDDVAQDLRSGVDILNLLLDAPARDVDLHIVG